MKSFVKLLGLGSSVVAIILICLFIGMKIGHLTICIFISAVLSLMYIAKVIIDENKKI